MILKSLLSRHESVAIVCVITLFAVFASLIGPTWFNNLPSLSRDVSWLAIVAIGQAMVIISGEFDLSVGSVYAFVSMVFLTLLLAGVGPLLAFGLSMGLAALIGYINGLLTWSLRLPSLLVTLGFLFVYRGLVQFVTDGWTLVVPDEVRDAQVLQFLGGKFLGLHNSIYFCAILLTIFAFVMAKTQYGSHAYAVGGDEDAASATGVQTGRVKIRTFIICSMLTGFAGIITAANLSSVSTTTATAMEFETIAATVIGGVVLLGGAGTVWGAVLGVIALLSLRHGLILLGVSIFAYLVVLGIVLVGLTTLKGILRNEQFN